MRKVFCLLACVGLVLGGVSCGAETGDEMQGQGAKNPAEDQLSSQEEMSAGEDDLSVGEGQEDTQVSVDKKGSKGIYYEKIDRKQVCGAYDPMACYAYPSFCFRDALYTGSDVFTWETGTKEVKELKKYKERYLGEEIGKAYGNHEHYWSDISSDLQEVTESVGVYRVKGVSEKNRICLFYKSPAGEGESEYYVMQMFDCLNGIHLEYGRELFQERLCMDNLDIAVEESDERWSKKMVREWKEKLYRGKFVKDDDGVIANRVEDQERFVTFADDLGMSVELCLGDGGEVVLSRGGNRFVLQLEK